MSSVADVIAAALHHAGVRAVFGVPGGGSSLEIIEAALRVGLPFVLTATETAGAIAAIAQAELSGTPGACLAGLGPGAASVVNGVACGSLDRAPLIVITDAHPAAAQGRFEHQRFDQRALLAPVTKWSATLTANNAADVLAEAVARAMAHPRGPVHIECPADVAGQLTVNSSQSTANQPSCGPSTVNCRLPPARHPLLIAGLAAREHADAVRAFCAAHRVPAMVTYKAKGVVPDVDAHFAGVFTNGGIEREIVDQADLLIAVGLDRVELLPRGWTYPQPVIEIDRDIDAALRELDTQLATSAWNLPVPRTRLAPAIARHGIAPDAVVRIVSEGAPTARVTVDAGAHMFPATMLWPCRAPGDLLISNGLSTMGFALPAAIGAALFDRERPVVALTGDGGLLMCAGELLTLARERLHVIVVVFDDRSLSLIDVKQRQRRFERAGVEVGSVTWAAAAESFGLRGHAAETEEELARAVASALAANGPTLIDVRVDPAPYDAMIRAIRG